MKWIVATLLVSALTSTGLLACWAALSTRGLLTRTTLYFGALATLLLIPAPEVFLMFVLQGTLVACGIRMGRIWSTSASIRRPRFQLREALYIAIPVSVIFAVIAQTPHLNWLAWQSVLLIGAVSGLATLIAIWVCKGIWQSFWQRFLIGLGLATLISLLLVWGDWLFLCLVLESNWPPDRDTLFNFFATSSGYAENSPILPWIGIIVGSTGLLVVLNRWFLLPLIQDYNGEEVSHNTKVCGAICILTVASPALVAWVALVNVPRIPETPIPEPNGWEDFNFAVQLLPSNCIVNGAAFDSATASLGTLRAAETEMQAAQDRMQLGLSRECLYPVRYEFMADLDMDRIIAMRTLARGLEAQGALKIKEGKPIEAAHLSIQNIELGPQLCRGGLMVHGLVGVAISRIGCGSLWEHRDAVPIDEIPALIGTIERAEENWESDEAFIERDQLWAQHALGWYGRLLFHLKQLPLGEDWGEGLFGGDMDHAFRDAMKKNLAILRLLRVELALRAALSETGEWPKSLDQLLPKHLASIPADPFSPTGTSLQYSLSEDGYLLYSVGANAVDDGGIPFKEDEFGFRDESTRDLRLDIEFAPETEVAQVNELGEDAMLEEAGSSESSVTP